MKRALELAQLGTGSVSPNPMVGCVIVCNESIIGEGYHMQYGGPHAEVNAVNDVSDPALLPNSTAFVTLEPCSHFGKTPPCTDLLIEKKIKRVVIASRDPFSLVDGKGIEKLESYGITVETGLLQNEAQEQNRRFFTYHQKKRPYVILKWAQTSDGYLAKEDGTSKWISGSYSRQWVHKYRASEDAILVGKNTAQIDNPSLTVRDWYGKNPTRVLLDSNLDIAGNSEIMNDRAPTLIFNLKQSKKAGNKQWIKVETMTPKPILEALYHHKIQSVIIEGGAKVLLSFIQEGLWDEAYVFKSKNKFHQGIEAPSLAPGFIWDETSIQNDVLTTYRNHG
ncbi:MAG: bifunctional diaminohydroxyphosphoribosylaminopyrimidine deaminase/5-amino-6-(5-phosphoribosylamino)uracil reductase RibD [Bacteroidota bacterium]